MNIMTKRLIMNGPVFTIFYTIYTYLLLTLISNLFSQVGKSLILPLAVIICGVYLIATIFEALYPNKITRSLAIISESWKGVSIYLTLLVIIIYIIGWITTITQEQIFVALITLVPIIGIYGLYNADNPRIKNIDLEFDNISEPVRFIHISDVHIGAIRGDRLLNKIVEEINQEYKNGIDFVLITGDLADGSGPIGPNSFKPLSKLKVPVFFTPGNHDFYPGIKNVIVAAKRANIKVLSDEIINIKGVQIIGFPYNNKGIGSNAVAEAAHNLDKLEHKNNEDFESTSHKSDSNKPNSNKFDFDKYESIKYESNKFDFDELNSNKTDSNKTDFNKINSNKIGYNKVNCNKIDKNKVSIALHHVPIGWEIFKEHGIELVLTGHTHGGQFFPFNILVKAVFPYLRGLYEDNGQYMFVSDGIGTLDPPMRIGTSSEIAIFNLKRKK